MCAYALESGQKNVVWLERLDGLLGGASRAFLTSNGLAKGMKVLDLGCGPGVLVPWLSEQVGPTGHIYATDQVEERVEATIRRARKHNLTNVTGIHSLPAALNLPPNSLDIVFVRNAFVYMHQPKQVIKLLHKVLKPGGLLIIEEPVVGTTQLVPAAPCIDAFKDKILELGKAQNAHYRIAPLLAELLRRNNFTITRHQIHTQRLTFEDIVVHLYPMFVTQVKAAMIAHNIITQEAVNSFLTELSELDPSTYSHGNLATHVRIVAVKTE